MCTTAYYTWLCLLLPYRLSWQWWATFWWPWAFRSTTNIGVANYPSHCLVLVCMCSVDLSDWHLVFLRTFGFYSCLHRCVRKNFTLSFLSFSSLFRMLSWRAPSKWSHYFWGVWDRLTNSTSRNGGSDFCIIWLQHCFCCASYVWIICSLVTLWCRVAVHIRQWSICSGVRYECFRREDILIERPNARCCRVQWCSLAWMPWARHMKPEMELHEWSLTCQHWLDPSSMCHFFDWCRSWKDHTRWHQVVVTYVSSVAEMTTRSHGSPWHS